MTDPKFSYRYDPLEIDEGCCVPHRVVSPFVQPPKVGFLPTLRKRIAKWLGGDEEYPEIRVAMDIYAEDRRRGDPDDLAAWNKSAELKRAELKWDEAIAAILMISAEANYDPKIDPNDTRDPRWTPCLRDVAKLRESAIAYRMEAAKLRGALQQVCALIPMCPGRGLMIADDLARICDEAGVTDVSPANPSTDLPE